MRFFNIKIGSVITFLIFALSFFAQAEEKIYSSRNRVHVKSDKLTIDNAKNNAVFIGNVIAVYDDISISADTLHISYNKASSEKNISEEKAVKKIVASGNVEITTEKYKGYADNAEYIVSSDTLLLSGGECKVTDDKNSIKGGIIILNKKTGNLTVEGTESSRVETTFFRKE